jgi:hypothetical protein
MSRQTTPCTLKAPTSHQHRPSSRFQHETESTIIPPFAPQVGTFSYIESMFSDRRYPISVSEEDNRMLDSIDISPTPFPNFFKSLQNREYDEPAGPNKFQESTALQSAKEFEARRSHWCHFCGDQFDHPRKLQSHRVSHMDYVPPSKASGVGGATQRIHRQSMSQLRGEWKPLLLRPFQRVQVIKGDEDRNLFQMHEREEKNIQNRDDWGQESTLSEWHEVGWPVGNVDSRNIGW